MSAPTTAEVRAMVGRHYGGPWNRGERTALLHVALPLAEERDARAADLATVVERIGRAAERLGLGDAAECSVDDPDLGYLTAVEDLHNAVASTRNDRDAERARADAAEAESKRRGELLAAERERYVALQRTLDNERHAAMDKSAALMAAEAEVGRMRKLFDDAGQGTYDVLALVEHWQAEAMRMASENDRFREALDIVCQWWGGCGHHPDDCPEDDAGDLVEDECKASKRVTDLTKGEGR